jgi:hypothetical protein
MHVRRLIVVLFAAAGLLAAAPAAQAAYAPKLAVTVNPTDQPGKTVAFISVVTQASDEEATKSARLKFPIGYGLDVRALQRLTSCTPVQRDARSCPESSRLGTATANALGQTLSGGVHLGEGATIYIFLNNATLRLLGQEPKPIVARTEFRPDGGTDTVLDDLPTDFTATRFELALDGPPKSVLNAPTKCGRGVFTGEFTSRNGVKATSTSAVTITGCPPEPAAPLALTGVTLAPRTLAAGRNALLRYTVDRPARVEITVRRAGRAKVLGRKRFTQRRAGRGKITVATRGLSPGRFVVTLRVTADGRTVRRVFAIRVR